MINYIKGTIAGKLENGLLIENNGIGFFVFASINTIASIGKIGEPCEIQTYMHVKEDEISLYGFGSMEERDMFTNLISVSGIGPKGALQILSGVTIDELSNAIFAGDANMIGHIKGIGKKTAEKLIVELRGKVNTFSLPKENKASVGQMGMFDVPIDDAVEALVTLGLTKADAVKYVRKVAEPMDSAEDIIQKVLKSRA